MGELKITQTMREFKWGKSTTESQLPGEGSGQNGPAPGTGDPQAAGGGGSEKKKATLAGGGGMSELIENGART